MEEIEHIEEKKNEDLPFEFALLPSQIINLPLRVGPNGSLSSCKVGGRSIVVVNSGESVLFFDIALSVTNGTSGLISSLKMVDILQAINNKRNQ